MIAWLEKLEAIWAVVCWFSFIIYVLFLVALMKGRKKSPLDSDFFKICRWVAVYDLIMIISTYTYRILSLELISSRSFRLWGKRFIAPLIFYAGAGEHSGVIMTAINRFTSMLLPLQHQKIWQRILIPGYALSVFFALILAVGVGVSNEYVFYYEFDNNTNKNTLKLLTKVQEEWMAVAGLYVVIASLVCSVLYSITVASLALKKTHNVTPTRKSEIKLTVCGMLLFLILLLYCVVLISVTQTARNYKTDPNPHRVSLFLVMLIGELYACINPYLVMACSRSARVAFIDVCRDLAKVFGFGSRVDETENRDGRLPSILPTRHINVEAVGTLHNNK